MSTRHRFAYAACGIALLLGALAALQAVPGNRHRDRPARTAAPTPQAVSAVATGDAPLATARQVIEGTCVRVPDGTPAAGILITGEGGESEHAVSGADGSFRLAAGDTPPHTLHATHPDYVNSAFLLGERLPERPVLGLLPTATFTAKR